MPANDDFYYGFGKESTEGAVVKPDSPFRFASAVLPLVDHEHTYCFALSEHKALRGCDGCGKAWIARHDGVTMGTWREIEERHASQ